MASNPKEIPKTVSFDSRIHDNNNGNTQHEYIPPMIHLLPWDGTLDADSNPVRQLEVIHDEAEAEALFDRLNMRETIITSQDRFHGGHRQKLWALYNMRYGDLDSRKRGGDKWKKYSRILREAKLEDIDWRHIPAEVFIFATSKRDPKTNAAKYTGVCVFASDNEAGREVIKRLEVGAKKKRDWSQPRPNEGVQAQQVQQPPNNAGNQPVELAGDGFVNTPTVTVRRSARSSADGHTYAFPKRGAEKGSGRPPISSARE